MSTLHLRENNTLEIKVKLSEEDTLRFLEGDIKEVELKTESFNILPATKSVKVNGTEIETDNPTTNNPIKPNHYNQADEDLITSWSKTYTRDCFVAAMKTHIHKYVYRFDKKNGKEDLLKAKQYIDRLIEYLEEMK